MVRAWLTKVALAMRDILRARRLLFALALVSIFLFFVQGLIGYFAESKEPLIQAAVKIGILFVAAILSSIVTTLYEDWKIKRDLDALGQDLQDAFDKKHKGTFDANVKAYLTLRDAHPAIEPTIDEQRLSRWYFDWMEFIALERDWKRAYEQFSDIEKRFLDYEPLASLIYFEDQVQDARKIERAAECLKQLSPQASLKLLKYHYLTVQRAVEQHPALEIRLGEFASRPELSTKEKNELNEFLDKNIFKKNPPIAVKAADSDDFYSRTKIERRKLQEVLNGRTEEEPDHTVNGKYMVPLLSVSALLGKEHIAVIGRKGEGKTFAKERFHAECKGVNEILYFEWEGAQAQNLREEIDIAKLEVDFYTALTAACSKAERLKDLTHNLGSDIEAYKKVFRQNEIGVVFLVMDLGNLEDDRFVLPGPNYERARCFFQAMPKKQIFSGAPTFYLRLFVNPDLSANVRQYHRPVREILLNWHSQVEVIDPKALGQVQRIDPKALLIRKRIQYMRQSDTADLNPDDTDLFEPGIIEEIAATFGTPREIIGFLQKLLEAQALKYDQTRDDRFLQVSRQDYQAVLAEWQKEHLPHVR